MSSTDVQTFVEALLAGEALVSDYEDWEERWHEADDSDPIASMELHEFLGLSFEEYKTVAFNPATIKSVVAQRHGSYPGSQAGYDLAARSGNLEMASRLLDELKRKHL